MKAFISGVITLSILIIAVIFNSLYIVNATDDILLSIEDLSLTGSDISALYSIWKKHSPIMALTVDRRTIDEIEDTLSLLKAQARDGNENEYLISIAHLKSLFQRLRTTESFNISRIF